VASGSQYLVTHNIRDFQWIGELGVTPMEQSPALNDMDIITEYYECLMPGITKLLIERFAVTH
jgi:hypothetical protein